jgi:hypothetical protein
VSAATSTILVADFLPVVADSALPPQPGTDLAVEVTPMPVEKSAGPAAPPTSPPLAPSPDRPDPKPPAVHLAPGPAAPRTGSSGVSGSGGGQTVAAALPGGPPGLASVWACVRSGEGAGAVVAASAEPAVTPD